MESAESPCLAAVAVGKQFEGADLDEAGRQKMEQAQQKSANLLRAQLIG
jgi:hypothetical protein